MQENEKKDDLLKRVRNVSSMVIVVVFVVLCVIIAAVIGIYSLKKGEQVPETGVAQGEETRTEETDATEASTDDTAQIGEEQTSTAQTGETEGAAEQEIVFESCAEDGILVTLIHTGGWGEEDDPFEQYELVIENGTEVDISDWCIKIEIGKEAVCNNIWNGEAEIEDGVLIITPADFNGTIVCGTQASVGIIIEKPDTPVFEGVTFKTV